MWVDPHLSCVCFCPVSSLRLLVPLRQKWWFCLVLLKFMEESYLSIAQNLSRICSNGLFFRKFLSQHFCGLCFGFRALHSAQKHFRKLSRTELISQAFANFPELSQAFANEKLAQSFADLSRLHVLLSRRHNTLTSLQIVSWEVLAAAHLSNSNNIVFGPGATCCVHQIYIIAGQQSQPKCLYDPVCSVSRP